MIMSSSHPTQRERDLIHFLFFFPLVSRASNYGLVKFDYTGRVLQFFEKPKGADLESMVSNSLSTSFVFFLSLMNASLSFFYGPILLSLFRND
jgi:hypothetical protein